VTETAELLSPERGAQLADFARACRAAARVVAMYPSTHPAIAQSLDRLSEVATRLVAKGSVSLTVLPDSLLLDQRRPDRPDRAIGELATLLHAHHVGELTLVAALSVEAWHTFLRLVARPPEEVRREGGLAKLWQGSGGGSIDIRHIDYAEVLKEREHGTDTSWDRIVAGYLEGDQSDLDEEAIAALLEIAQDPSRLAEFVDSLVEKAQESKSGIKAENVLRILQVLADFVAQSRPEQLDAVLFYIAAIVPKLTPEIVAPLVAAPASGGIARGIDLAGEVKARVSDEAVAEFVASSVIRDRGASARLIEAFQTLVPEPERQARLIHMAHEETRLSPFGRAPEFSDLWKKAQEMLTSYSDAAYVGSEYGRELPAARLHAADVERASDDPPERINSWLSSVADRELRRLDQQLLDDLLRIETRPEAWKRVLETVIARVDHLVLLGDILLAQSLVDAVAAAGADSQPFAADARRGFDSLRRGAVVEHVVHFIRQADEIDLPAAAGLCRALGTTVIRPLIEAIKVEQNNAAIRRLRDVLVTFGAAGRPFADELRTSGSPVVRRMAIDLVRGFGAAEALRDLAPMIDDSDPGVQREAIRSIVHLGTTASHATLERALASGAPRTREAIMQVLTSARDERAAPLLAHVVQRADYRGHHEATYRSIIDALGKISGANAAGLEALRFALHRGEWWAPGRTRRIRHAAARALRAAGSEAAESTLQRTAQSGPRGARRAAQEALDDLGGSQETS
jgi:HEAT repeats